MSFSEAGQQDQAADAQPGIHQITERNMRRSKWFFALVSVTLLVFVTGALAAQAQNAPQKPPRSVLAPLNRMLHAAGAAALSADQEQQLTGLITAFRDSHKPPAPDGSRQGAITNLDNAILKGDKAAAASQATAIANEAAGLLVARMKDQALFAIDALKVLTADQVSLLVNRVGSRGVVRMMESLAGPRALGMGAGRMGAGMGGPGMMMRGNPR